MRQMLRLRLLLLHRIVLLLRVNFLLRHPVVRALLGVARAVVLLLLLLSLCAIVTGLLSISMLRSIALLLLLNLCVLLRSGVVMVLLGYLRLSGVLHGGGVHGCLRLSLIHTRHADST